MDVYHPNKVVLENVRRGRTVCEDTRCRRTGRLVFVMHRECVPGAGFGFRWGEKGDGGRLNIGIFLRKENGDDGG